MQTDPLWTLSLSLPPGWALHPHACALNRLVFLDWCRPQERQLHARLQASHASALDSDSTWEARWREGLPPGLLRVERREGRQGAHGAVLWVEVPGRDGRPNERWALVRGLRFDAVLEQVGVPLGGALATRELLEAVRTLDVGINRHLGERYARQRYADHAQAAHAALQAGDQPGAMQALMEAMAVARSTWLHSLVGAPLPEVPAAVAVGEVLLQLAVVSGSSTFLREASLVLMRCRSSLQTMHAPGVPAPQRHVAALLAHCQALLAELAAAPPPGNDFTEMLMRSRVALGESLAALRADEHQADHPAAQAAVEDAMSAAALAGLGRLRSLPAEQAGHFVPQGVHDPQQQQLAEANGLLRAEALRHLVDAGKVHAAGQLRANTSLQRTRCANVLLAARELAQLTPGPEQQAGLVQALNLLGGALLSLGDEASMQEAQQLLDEAEQCLQALPGQGELHAQIFLNQAWLHYHQRRAAAGLAAAERALDAATLAKSQRLQRAARSLRALYLGLNGRAADAAREARAALDDTQDDAASTHGLNLAVVLHDAGDVAGAAEAVRLGLAAAHSDQPLAPEVLRLLFVAAACMDQADPPLARAAIEAAEVVLDALRIGYREQQDLIGFDDAAHHRQLAGSLVQRQLDAGDVLAALASADRHRARTLLQQLTTERPRAGPPPAQLQPAPAAQAAPTALAADAPLPAQIEAVAAAARRALQAAGQPMAPEGAALADLVAGHGRMALLCHPSGEKLLLLLVLPQGQSVGIVHAEAGLPLAGVLLLSERLRELLGIVVAARAARGLGSLKAAPGAASLAAEGSLDAAADEDLDELLKALHAALLQPLLPYLQPGQPLVLLPYRELSVVPLSLLRDDQGRLLGERHALSVLPSLATLQALAPAQGPALRAVVVGDPLLDARSGLRQLPGAAAEASEVAARLRAAGVATQVLLHEAATERALRTAAAGAHVVHLACHAALRAKASESPLYLTPQPPDDGLLLPSEIADLRLDGALVVLAACQSGLGRTTADGVLGLGRAFLEAGARCVLLSLWQVSDVATRELMAAFYEALIGSESTPPQDAAAALATAQRASRAARGNEPALWGAWLLVGDGGWRLRG